MSMTRDICMRVLAEVTEGLGYLTPLGAAADPVPDADAEIAEITFTGAHHGRCFVAASRGIGAIIATNMLGVETEIDPVTAQEALGELTNVLAGNALPSLYGDGVEIHLGIPHPCAIRPPADCWVTAIDLAEGRIAFALVSA